MSVQLYDTLPPFNDNNVLRFNKLKPILGSSIVRVKPADDGLEHMVEEAALGYTTIAFRTPAVRSSVENVLVSASLRIILCYITLVFGATFEMVSLFSLSCCLRIFLKF